MTKKKGCKNICKFCVNIRCTEEGEGLNPTCNEFSKEITSCVTGETETVHDLCSTHNKDGCCKKYSGNEDLLNNDVLLKAVVKYQERRYKTHGYCEYSNSFAVNFISEQLRKELNGETIDFYYDHMSDCWRYRYDEKGEYTKRYLELTKPTGTKSVQ